MPISCVLALVLAFAACDPDPTPRCLEAYDHLITLANRAAVPEERERFVGACRNAFDARRHTCLMEATTPEEATQCRPGKTRPG